jgi:thiosulfate dehydrogenase [quinone] large subunit
MQSFPQNQTSSSICLAGTLTVALRLVTGYTYFSAFWRRLVLENKFNPDATNYVGEKFNHFLPNALLIKPLIEYLVSHADLLWWFMLVFTLIECSVGLCVLLGLFTRLASLGVSSLALGILLGAGWLGTTCLDEWQIGVLGVAAGFTLMLTGGGSFAIDNRLLATHRRITSWKWFPWLASGELPLAETRLRLLAVIGGLAITGLTLFTDQYFHGGVWGKLHNLSAHPHVTIESAHIDNDALSFSVFRDQGIDVYGSFLIAITLRDAAGNIILQQDMNDLSRLSPGQIKNDYAAKVRPGKHSLILPLGARATLTFPIERNRLLSAKQPFPLELTDISGTIWSREINR